MSAGWGWSTDRDLDRLLAGAVGLVYPSRFEGCGLPLAEAMALRLPGHRIVRDRALPRWWATLALAIGPDDVAGWTAAMLRLLDDETLRSRLVAAGRERVAVAEPRGVRTAGRRRVPAGAGARLRREVRRGRDRPMDPRAPRGGSRRPSAERTAPR